MLATPYVEVRRGSPLVEFESRAIRRAAGGGTEVCRARRHGRAATSSAARKRPRRRIAAIPPAASKGASTQGGVVVKVQEFMSQPAHTCAPQDSLELAARLLWEHDCGVLPVIDIE